MKYTALISDNGKRLDIAILAKIKTGSRSQIQKRIKAGEVFVNGKVANSHFLLREGDVIKIVENIEKKITKKFTVIAKNVKTSADKIQVLAKTDDYLIINKPAGLIVHPVTGHQETSLADILLKKYPELSKVGEDPMRPGIVHRLDKEVSGLMVIARTSVFFDCIKNQFLKRLTKKSYTALVYGQISKIEDTINFPIERAITGHKMSALPLMVKGKIVDRGRRALTEFLVTQKFVNYTLLKVRIKTGRTHQIRVHMAAYGHPLVGDELYSTSKTRLQNKKLNLGRIFLVADELSFVNLAGQTKSFTLELPEELQNFLNPIK